MNEQRADLSNDIRAGEEGQALEPPPVAKPLTVERIAAPAATFTKVHFDFEHLPYLSSPRQALGTQADALGLISLPAGEGYTFTHSHVEQEEVYMVIEGKGCLWVDECLVALERGDLVRVAPPAKRALKAAEEQSLFIICAGAVAAGYPKEPGSRYLIDDGIPDYEDVPPWYRNDPAIAERNAKLKARMLKAQAKRQARQNTQD